MSGDGTGKDGIYDRVPKKRSTWKELAVFDQEEEEQIRKFEALRAKETYGSRIVKTVKTNPPLYIGLCSACYCLAAGMKSLIDGQEYQSLKYLEMRIYSQFFAVASVLGGAAFYFFQYRRQMLIDQPYGPYKAGYGMTHLQMYQFYTEN